MKYSTLFQTHQEYESFVSSETIVKPNLSYCINEDETHYIQYDFADKYFTTIARENGTISFNIWKNMGTEYIKSISYSTDDGETWNTTNNINNKSENLVIDVNVDADDKVLWKGDATQMAFFDDGNDYGEPIGSFFSSTCEFDVQGNVMSLLYLDNFDKKLTLEENYTFLRLFNDYDGEKSCGIVNAKNLSLPATVLTPYCYESMFQGCTSLTTPPKLPATILADFCYRYMFIDCTSLTRAPELPATTLAENCYEEMFMNCTSLITPPELPATTLAYGCYSCIFSECTNLTSSPELPATTLANSCYGGMFTGCINLQTPPELPATTLTNYCYAGMFNACTSLTTAPALPATTLAEGCYSSMFVGCENLTTAPELPATTLVEECYGFMFEGCTSLTTAPVLPATTLTDCCYQNMFRNCTNLNSITCFATDISATYCTDDWVEGVAATGTFIKADNMNNWTTGNDGIPTGWTTTINYLRFTALENDSTLQLKKYNSDSEEELTPTANVECSWDGINFTEYNYSELELSEGQTIYLRGNNVHGFSTYNNEDDYTWHSFTTSTGSFECHGNIMSLLYGADFETSPNALVIPNDFCFSELFYDSINDIGCNIITAPELPATVLTENCYYSMFSKCSNLITAPKLSVTTLADYCYSDMFKHCTSLTTAPELPATTLAIGCYDNMFMGCTSLETAPELPATTLAKYCYNHMFDGCISLTTAPELPATTLAEYCYYEMFYGCTSLITAPELPATTLAKYCYYYMFANTNVLPDTSNIDFTSTQVVASWGLCGLFAKTKITDNDLIIILPKNHENKYCLPVTTLTSDCYSKMFADCTNLTTAPVLPATTLANSCYLYMFSGCTSLITAPELPATTLAQSCYQSMFYNCTSLVNAPELPATTLTNSCYNSMFYGCTSLITAPVLPATTLIRSCYSNMFFGCTSLTVAPELPATTLQIGCYSNMFQNCTNLNYIKAMFTTTPSNTYTSSWVNGVAAIGTFVKNSSATWNVTGNNGIPTGWTVQTATE